MKKYNVAILGASGAVGQQMLPSIVRQRVQGFRQLLGRLLLLL